LETREGTALERVIFDILYAFFNFAFMAWGIRLCRQNHRAVMFAKGLDLGMDVRIVPVGIFYSRFQIVDNQGPGDTTKVPKGILQTANEVVGGLTIDDLAVRLARETQNDPKNVGTFALWACSPGMHSIRRNGIGLSCPKRLTNRRTL
jgi:hypothetical protein